MFIEMTCKCEASFQAEAEDSETLVMVWAQSFINAHTDCGYMTRQKIDSIDEKTKRYDIIYKENREKEL